MKNAWTKSTNQYFGELFEVSLCNELDINTGNFKIQYQFADDEIACVQYDANNMAKLLNNIVDFSDLNWFYCARNTVAALGDISNGNMSIELKYVNSGSGTYHNTSITYLNGFGIIPYHDFLINHGYYDQLAKIIPSMKANIVFNSPFTHEESHIIRHNMKNEYAEIEHIEKTIRAKYIDYVGAEIVHRNLIDTIFNDFLNKKKTSNKRYKGIPDLIAICNHHTGACRVIDKRKLSNLASRSSVCINGSSIIVNDVMRLVIGWQNGNGLSNPTIRCFLSI